MTRSDRLAHRYFDTSHAILTATVNDDLPALRSSIERLLAISEDEEGETGQ